MSEQDLIKAAREWVAECVWADIDDPSDLDDFTDAQIKRGVNRSYDGGWAQFVRDFES